MLITKTTKSPAEPVKEKPAFFLRDKSRHPDSLCSSGRRNLRKLFKRELEKIIRLKIMNPKIYIRSA